MPIAKPNCHTCQARCQGPIDVLSGSALADFNAKKSSRIYSPGQILYYEGNQAFGVYCIEQGKIKLSKTANDGKHYIANIAQTGDLLGYGAILAEEPFATTAEVLVKSTVCFITQETFLSTLQMEPELPIHLLNLISSELIRTENQNRDLAYHSVIERMAALLLMLSQKFGQPQSDDTCLIEVNLSREDLASLLGTTVESAVRTLTFFRNQNLIAYQKKMIILKDLEQLALWANGQALPASVIG